MFAKERTSALGMEAMEESRQIVDALGLGRTEAFIYSDRMLSWEADKVT